MHDLAAYTPETYSIILACYLTVVLLFPVVCLTRGLRSDLMPGTRIYIFFMYCNNCIIVFIVTTSDRAERGFASGFPFVYFSNNNATVLMITSGWSK
jgi:hypothetical protein